MSNEPVILHVGVFGRGFSGKTTLNKRMSQSYWRDHGVKTLALDFNNEKDWGPQAFVTKEEDVFWDMTWHRETGCALFVEEASESIARDNEKTGLFTRVRHRGHRLHVSGHSGVNLTPEQRAQLHVLFLFQQTKKMAEQWRETFMDDRIMQATTLRQYEFLHCILWGDNGQNLVKRRTLAI